MKLICVTIGILALFNVVASNLPAQADQSPRAQSDLSFHIRRQERLTLSLALSLRSLRNAGAGASSWRTAQAAIGLIAISQVAAAEPDGYTLLSVASSRLTLTSATSRKQIDFERDFAPITRIGFVPNVVVVHPSLPVTTILELIAQAKTKARCTGVRFAIDRFEWPRHSRTVSAAIGSPPNAHPL